MKTCANCEIKIGNLEPTFTYQGDTVCFVCHQRLTQLDTASEKSSSKDSQTRGQALKSYTVRGRVKGYRNEQKMKVQAKSAEQAKQIAKQQDYYVTSVGLSEDTGFNKFWVTVLTVSVLGACFYIAHQAGYNPRGAAESVVSGEMFLPSLTEAERELRQSSKPHMQRVIVNLSWREGYDGNHFVAAEITTPQGNPLPEASQALYRNEGKSVVRSYAPDHEVRFLKREGRFQSYE